MTPRSIHWPAQTLERIVTDNGTLLDSRSGVLTPQRVRIKRNAIWTTS